MESCSTPMPMATWPLYFERRAVVLGPHLRSVRRPSAAQGRWRCSFRMMLSNSAGWLRRPTTRTGIWKACCLLAGGCPSCPAGISTFCSCSALTTSSAVRSARRHTNRIKPDAHRIFALAEDHHVAHARHALDGIFDVHVEIIGDEFVGVAAVAREESSGENEVGADLGDGDAGWITAEGRRPCTLATRFCTSTAAMSRLYPVWNVTVMVLMPLLVLEELM